MAEAPTHRTPGDGGYARGYRCQLCTAAHADNQRAYERRNAERITAARHARRRRRPTFQFEDLERAIAAASTMELARLLDVDRRRELPRLRRDGLSMDQADELATRVGLHPRELWPTW